MSVIIDRRFLLTRLRQRTENLDSAVLPVAQTTNRWQRRSSLQLTERLGKAIRQQ